jgi:hypothetical protein
MKVEVTQLLGLSFKGYQMKILHMAIRIVIDSFMNICSMSYTFSPLTPSCKIIGVVQ